MFWCRKDPNLHLQKQLKERFVYFVHGNLRGSPRGHPPRNKALIFGLMKGNQWHLCCVIEIAFDDFASKPVLPGGRSTDEAVGRAVARCTQVSTAKFKDCDLKAELVVLFIVYYFGQEPILIYVPLSLYIYIYLYCIYLKKIYIMLVHGIVSAVPIPS